jgi:DNA polymerase III subunit delta
VAKKRIYYSEFRRNLESGGLAPVYLFTGAETFLKEEGVAAVVEKAVPPAERSLNMETLYAGDVTGQDVRERALTLPFFTSHRGILVRQVEKWKAPDVKAMADYAADPSGATTLILSSQDERVKGEGWNAVAALAYHVECYPLFDNQVPDWVERRSREHGKRIGHSAVQLLIELAGQSLADLDNELGKLASYVGPRETVTDEDVRAAAGHLREETIFDFNLALGRKQWREAVRLVHALVEEGANAPQTLGAVAWHFRSLYAELAKVADGEPLDRVLAGVRNPQARAERAEQLKRTALADVPAMFRDLLDLDGKVKTGQGHWDLLFLLKVLQWQARDARQAARA